MFEQTSIIIRQQLTIYFLNDMNEWVENLRLKRTLKAEMIQKKKQILLRKALNQCQM